MSPAAAVIAPDLAAEWFEMDEEADRSLYARIDDDAPTRAELVAALNKAGVLVEDARKPHAGGSCCGSCGG